MPTSMRRPPVRFVVVRGEMLSWAGGCGKPGAFAQPQGDVVIPTGAEPLDFARDRLREAEWRNLFFWGAGKRRSLDYATLRVASLGMTGEAYPRPQSLSITTVNIRRPRAGRGRRRGSALRCAPGRGRAWP